MSRPLPETEKGKEGTTEKTDKEMQYTRLSDDDQDTSVELPAISAPKRKRSANKEADEGRKADNKKKKERLQVRQEQQMKASEPILSHGTVQDNSHQDDRIQRLEEKVDSVLQTANRIFNAVDALLNCKTCLKKAYRKLGSSERSSTIGLPSTPKSLKASSSAGSPLQMGPLSPLALPVPTSPTMQPETTPVQGEIGNDEFPAEKMPGQSIDELCFLGDARFNVKISRTTLNRCEKAAKTAEKLALNLIEFLLTKNEIQKVTVYGNRQHAKEPMDENKRKALRSHIFSRYHKDVPSEEKGKLWEKLVISINDKIQGLRNGKYKYSNLN